MPPAEELCRKTLALEAENAALRAENAWYKKQVFGRTSEKMPAESPAQGKLGLGETPQTEPKRQSVKYERRVVPAEKRPMPAEVFKDLPVMETIEIVPEEVKADPESYEQIGEERTFEVELIGPQLLKREIVRPKYRQKADAGRGSDRGAGAAAGGGRGLRLGGPDRLGRHLQVPASPAPLPDRGDVGAVGGRR